MSTVNQTVSNTTTGKLMTNLIKTLTFYHNQRVTAILKLQQTDQTSTKPDSNDDKTSERYSSYANNIYAERNIWLPDHKRQIQKKNHTNEIWVFMTFPISLHYAYIL